MSEPVLVSLAITVAILGLYAAVYALLYVATALVLYVVGRLRD